MIVLLLTTSIPSGSIGIKSTAPQQEILPQHSLLLTTRKKPIFHLLYHRKKSLGNTTPILSRHQRYQTLYDTYQDLIKEMTSNPYKRKHIETTSNSLIFSSNNALPTALQKTSSSPPHNPHHN